MSHLSRLLVVLLLLQPVTSFAAEEVLAIEDNLGFAGPALNFVLRDDGSWSTQQRFPKPASASGKLEAKEVEALMAALTKAGAFDAKSKDVQPVDPQVRDGDSFSVTKLEKGKRFPLSFKRESATSQAVLKVIAGLSKSSAAALWDMESLGKAPKMTWGDGEPKYSAKPLYYEGEPYQGKPTRVFAYYAAPKDAKGKVPAMVLVHGGGGTAFPQWAKLWADRGYAAIAMDLAGCGPDGKRMADGGPGQSDKEKFEDVKADALKDAWSYHAVANVIRAHSLLRSMPEVDAERTGLTGISWGGYLTSMTVGVDDRFKVAVPVYGCGFLHENSTWLGNFKKLGPEATALWVKHFDPSNLLSNCNIPTLWVNGTNDFAYPMDSYKKSYSLVKGPRTLCVTVRMPHGHEEGWKPKVIGLFVDQYLAAEKPKPFAKVSNIVTDNRTVSTTFHSEVPIKSAGLHYTTDTGAWKDRKWQTIAVKPEATGKITAALPADKGIVYFFTVTDERGVTVSTEHEVLE